MQGYSFILKRALAALPTLLTVLTIAFLTLRLAPGDPVSALLGDSFATPEVVAQMREHYGLDQPVVFQYLTYLLNAAMGDFGTSLRTGQPVLAEILKVFPNTVLLALFSVVFAVLIGVPLGLISALRPNSLVDHAMRVFALIGLCAPSFALALLLMLVFSFYLNWFPFLGAGDAGDVGSILAHLVLPALALALRDSATIARLTRTTMLTVLSEDYITTARAKGVAEKFVLFKHALKNALLPILAIVLLEFAQTIAGAVVIETVFSRPGIGSLIVQSISARDYPLLQGTMIFCAFCIVVVNLFADIFYKLIDPRIDYSRTNGR